MNIFKKLKLGVNALRFLGKIKESYMTKGMKSSEFWLTVIGSLVTMFQAIQGTLDPKTATIIGATLTAVYTIARALTKSGEAKTATSDQ